MPSDALSRVFVTGGQGFLGAYVVRSLLRGGSTVALLDLSENLGILRQVLTEADIGKVERSAASVSGSGRGAGTRARRGALESSAASGTWRWCDHGAMLRRSLAMALLSIGQPLALRCRRTRMRRTRQWGSPSGQM